MSLGPGNGMIEKSGGFLPWNFLSSGRTQLMNLFNSISDMGTFYICLATSGDSSPALTIISNTELTLNNLFLI